jgi:tight adherence protein B
VQLQVAGGATVRDAWSAALAADSGFPAPAVRRCLAIHSDLPSALREDAATCPEFALAAVVVQLGEASGAPVSQPLGDVAQIARDRVEIDRTVAQEVAATKASVAVLAGLPGFGLCLAWLLGSDPAWLIHSPAGLLCLLGGLVLEVSGALWLRRMVRVAVKC